MKRATPDCTACHYKLGFIKTLFDPCERCKEMYKMYGAVHCDKTIYEFSKTYRRKNGSEKLRGSRPDHQQYHEQEEMV